MTGISIFIASRTTSGWRGGDTRRRRRRSTRDHGSRHRRGDRAVAVRGGAGQRLRRRPGPLPGGGGRLSRHGCAKARAPERSGGGESGACSTRNAVETAPARNAGCRTSQRRNGRFVTTPSTTVSSSARASRSSASSRSAPCAISFASSGSYDEADLVALLDARVDADAGGQDEPVDAPGLGQERPRILGVEPRLDRVAVGARRRGRSPRPRRRGAAARRGRGRSAPR